MSALKEWTWTYSDPKDGEKYLISTAKPLISHTFISDAMASPELYWTKPMAPENIQPMIDNCCIFGLYCVPSTPPGPPSKPAPETPADAANPATTQLQQIGLARLITDYVTFCYLTDVYVLQSYKGRGLGRWLVRCVKEVIDAHPELRRAALLTNSEGRGVGLYREELGMEIYDGKEGFVVMMVKGER
ncbi:hypothetical protein K402DRAFT_395323 [Aulographum hederae CBS 113979]|uniref:N-acetyltransferase domain-containing protein n=1 Tax=Aulographum hederae CBS 113979 TaxID=1176131 RepID=A0A6G1GVW9_9PEZI|nr:hypothetical protein K402DRAFT_395323 [Aulographum hederae CBS 113979]